MSYEPIIYIRKSDLEAKRDHIENAEWDTIPNAKFIGNNKEEQKENLSRAYAELLNALGYETIKFPEIELVVLYVEFTSRNGAVRDLLNDLKIDFRIQS